MHSFVTEIQLQLAEKIKEDLTEQGFLLTKPPYTLFSAKKPGLSCTLYESGKLVVQGKEMRSFIEFYLEPQILCQKECNIEARIGVDEAGKGDFFGPLCIAGVYADEQGVYALKNLGVQDSKNLSDSTIGKLAKEIRKCCTHQVIAIFPQRYNEMYQSFKNLNTLLAWGHATVIEKLVQTTNCTRVIIDQFAHESVVLQALKRKNLSIPLTQRHRAEEDLVVAAASILARDAFVEGLKALSHEVGMTLPKGGGRETILAGKQIFHTHGMQIFSRIAKLHFKNYSEIIQT